MCVVLREFNRVDSQSVCFYYLFTYTCLLNDLVQLPWPFVNGKMRADISEKRQQCVSPKYSWDRRVECLLCQMIFFFSEGYNNNLKTAFLISSGWSQKEAGFYPFIPLSSAQTHSLYCGLHCNGYLNEPNGLNVHFSFNFNEETCLSSQAASLPCSATDF